MWFENLTGFSERSPGQVRETIRLEGGTLHSLANGRVLICGRLETPSLAELRERVHSSGYSSGKLTVREVVANVQDLHADASNANALFQVASQFNLLEMVSPDVTPEQGVGIYEHDHTQGPACAIAAGAGTIYRNYFADVNGQAGQSARHQIDCLADLGIALGNTEGRLWEMRNGYPLASRAGLVEISERLKSSGDAELDGWRRLLRIGIQWRTQVTLKNCSHLVSQAYGSALPVAYSRHASNLWGPFARLILEASYEATICTAILNATQYGSNRLFLTLLGGGAFGNDTDWILDALQRTLNLYRHVDLDVAIVSYGASNPQVRRLASAYGS
jgi:hypothetical protein